MNSVTLHGRLGKDPTIKSIGQKQTPCCRFSLATKDGRDKTDWHNIVLWGKQAENAAQILRKGDAALVTGKLSYNEWEKDGVKQKMTEVNSFYFEKTAGERVDASDFQPTQPPANPGDLNNIPF